MRSLDSFRVFEVTCEYDRCVSACSSSDRSVNRTPIFFCSFFNSRTFSPDGPFLVPVSSLPMTDNPRCRVDELLVAIIPGCQ